MCTLLAGCTLAAPPPGAGRPGAGTRPTAPPVATQAAPNGKTRIVSQVGAPTRLTGTVKLISDRGGAIISDNGGGVVSQHGGAVISNNSGGLVSKTRYRLAASPDAAPGTGAGVAEYALAEAVIRLYDATGAQLVDDRGQPLTATSGPDGGYTLSAVLPRGNVVLRVTLYVGGALSGGELAALVAQPAEGPLELPIDTASSLGAAYVLGKLVRGDQATFDKLPAREAAQLASDARAATALLTEVPLYREDALIDLSEVLRARAPALSRTLDAIEALLLGQTHGGDGRAATTVALFAPAGLALDQEGRLLVGEPNFGRLRQVEPDGTVSTLADVVRGRFKLNFPDLRDLVRGPDGALDVATRARVVRLRPDGSLVTLAGDGTARYGPTDVAATGTGVQPGRLALGPDGTLYVGERRSVDDDPGPARVLAIARDGIARRVPVDDTWGASGRVHGLAVAPDGTLYVLYVDLYAPGSSIKRLYAYHPDRGSRVVAEGFPLAVATGYLVRGKDGTLYVSEPDAGIIEAIAPDGARRTVADAATPGGPRFPTHMCLAPDGTLLVTDPRAGRVFALGPAGGWRVAAGTDAAVQIGGDLTNLPLNAPYAAAFDRAGGLIVAEEGGRTIKRFDGKAITTLAGAFEGAETDGRPAREIAIGPPRGVALRGEEIVFSEDQTGFLRAIAADGTLRTLAGALPVPGFKAELAAGERVAPSGVVAKGGPLTLDVQGRLYWSNGARQVLRMAADGQIELVAGKPGPAGTSGFLPDYGTLLNPDQGDGGPATAATLSAPMALAFDGRGDLYIADIRNMRVRKVSGLDGPSPTIATFAGAPLPTLMARMDQLARAEEGFAATDATLIAPSGLCFDASGNLLVSELGTVALPLYGTISGAEIGLGDGAIPPVHARVRKITPDGTITTVAGPGSRFLSDPTAADALVLPTALAIAPDGRLAIVDTGANMIRILPAGAF